MFIRKAVLQYKDTTADVWRDDTFKCKAMLLNCLIDDELTVNLTFSKGFYIQDFKLTKLPKHACTVP